MFCFQGLARNLEQPEVKDWLTETKDQLMGDKSAKEKDTEGDKVTAIITRQVQSYPHLLHVTENRYLRCSVYAFIQNT
jgi:hypothetical protein